jgi:hypothetical protein
LGNEAHLAARGPELSAAARTLRGLYRSTTNVALIRPFDCGGTPGLLLLVAEGNDKDEASIVAAGAVAVAFAGLFAAPLLAEVDLPPTLRRAVLEGHDRVWALSNERVAPGRFRTVGQPRATLCGIGASVACAALLPHRAWLTWVGECPIWLLRGGEARRLSLPHTLGHDPRYRAAVASDPPVREELHFDGQRVVAIGQATLDAGEDPTVQRVLAPHVAIESLSLDPIESPYAPGTTEVRTPPTLASARNARDHLDR